VVMAKANVVFEGLRVTKIGNKRMMVIKRYN